ncbi:MAG: hypothetical protein EBU08_19580 [Micrococcales bacterium]|nr:hypothetical protein [Micrococcales bacterium]
MTNTEAKSALAANEAKKKELEAALKANEEERVELLIKTKEQDLETVRNLCKDHGFTASDLKGFLKRASTKPAS